MVVNHSVVLEISLRFDSFWHTFFSHFLSFSFLMSSATHSVEFVMNDPQAVRHGFLRLSDSRAQFLIDRVLVPSLSPTAPRRAVFLLDAADSLLYLRMFWTRAAHTWLKSCTHRRSTIRLQSAAHPVLSFSFYGDFSSLFLAAFSPLHVLQPLLHFLSLVSNAINAFVIRFQTIQIYAIMHKFALARPIRKGMFFLAKPQVDEKFLPLENLAMFRSEISHMDMNAEWSRDKNR